MKMRDDGMNHLTKELKLPGLLSDPSGILKTDTRADPRLLAALSQFGFDEAQPDIPLDHTSKLEDQLAFYAEAEPSFEGFMQALFADVETLPDIDRKTEVIKGKDGNDITLYVHKPSNSTGDLPCIVHMHGGGMAMLTAQTPCYPHWRDLMCADGAVVVGVEFRNASGALGIHPYPAGLNDCMSALEWVNSNKVQLGVSKVVLSGESGGGNFCLAMTLRAKRENKLSMIQGTYALCPYIYGDYGNKSIDLPSMYENDGYFITAKMMSVLAAVYNPGKAAKDNHLAWPYWVDTAELKGLPPHVISVNELDLLRDEGLSYYRKLAEAGVSVYSRTVNGTTHAADVIFVKAIPEVTMSTIKDIKSFVDQI